MDNNTRETDVSRSILLNLILDTYIPVRRIKMKSRFENEFGLPKNGSPADRGSADKYYGRPCNPHWWPNGTYKGYRVSADDMTEEEISLYKEAYENEDDEKDWGNE